MGAALAKVQMLVDQQVTRDNYAEKVDPAASDNASQLELVPRTALRALVSTGRERAFGTNIDRDRIQALQQLGTRVQDELQQVRAQLEQVQQGRLSLLKGETADFAAPLQKLVEVLPQLKALQGRELGPIESLFAAVHGTTPSHDLTEVVELIEPIEREIGYGQFGAGLCSLVTEHLKNGTYSGEPALEPRPWQQLYPMLLDLAERMPRKRTSSKETVAAHLAQHFPKPEGETKIAARDDGKELLRGPAAWLEALERRRGSREGFTCAAPPRFGWDGEPTVLRDKLQPIERGNFDVTSLEARVKELVAQDVMPKDLEGSLWVNSQQEVVWVAEKFDQIDLAVIHLFLFRLGALQLESSLVDHTMAVRWRTTLVGQLEQEKAFEEMGATIGDPEAASWCRTHAMAALKELNLIHGRPDGVKAAIVAYVRREMHIDPPSRPE